MLRYLGLGFIINFVTSLDDTLTRVPVLASVTHTRKGKIIFSIGNLLAVTVAIFIAFFVSEIIKRLPYSKFIVAALIFFLAVTVYFEWFHSKPKRSIMSRLSRLKPLSAKRFFKILGIGFAISLVTILDDTIALAPLLTGSTLTTIMAIMGIYLAAFLQIFLIIYFSEKLETFPYKKILASGALTILSILVLFDVI